MNEFQNFHPARIGQGNTILRAAVFLLLATELFLTQLAISSPQLHGWLHGVDPLTTCQDDGCGSEENSASPQPAEHVCAITLMAEGFSGKAAVVEIHPSEALYKSLANSSLLLVEKPAMARHLARGPPHLFR